MVDSCNVHLVRPRGLQLGGALAEGTGAHGAWLLQLLGNLTVDQWQCTASATVRRGRGAGPAWGWGCWMDGGHDESTVEGSVHGWVRELARDDGDLRIGGSTCGRRLLAAYM